MKFLGLCILAMLVIVRAKPADDKAKVRKARDVDFGSFDFGSFDFGSFDIDKDSFGEIDTTNLGSDFDGQAFIGSVAAGFSALAQAGTDADSFAKGLEALASSFDNFGSESFDEAKLQSMLGGGLSQLVSGFSKDMPDPFESPADFAKYADTLQGQMGQHGEVGEALVNSFFDDTLKKGMTDLGIQDTGDLSASDFFEQMDTESWVTLSKLAKKKSIFKMDELSGDDFFGVIMMASSAPASELDKLLNIDEDSSLLTPDLIQQLPPEAFAILDPTVFKTALGNFTTDQKNALCQGMGDTDADTAETLFASVDCTDFFVNGGGEIDPEFEEAMFEALRGDKPVDQWTDNDWDKMANFAGGFDPEDFEAMPNDAILRNVDKFAGNLGEMEEEDIYSFMDNYEDAAGGDYSKISKDNLKKMGGMIQYMEPEDFAQIPPDVLYESMGSFGGIEFDDDVAAEMAESMFSVMPSFDKWTGDELGKVLDVLKYDEDSIDQIPIDAFIGSMDKFATFEMDEDEAMNFADKFMDDPSLGDPTNWNVTLIQKMGPVLSGFSPEFLSGMPSNVLVPALANMDRKVRDKIDFSRSSSRAVLDKVIAEFGSITNVPVNATGQLVKSYTSTEIGQMASSEVKNAMALFNSVYEDLEQSVRRAVVDKFKAAPEGLNHYYILGNFFQDLDMTEMDQLPYNLIDPKNPPKDPVDVKGLPAQTRRAWRNTVALIGNPSTAAGNWSIKMWKGLGNIICGMPCSEAQAMPLGKKTGSILQVIGEIERKHSGRCLSDGQMSCVAKRLESFFFKNGTVQHKYATKANLKKAARFLPFFSVENMLKFNQSLCSNILSNIGGYRLTNMPRKALINIKTYLMTCSGKAASGEQLTLKELRSVGDVMCGIEVDDVPKLAKPIFKNYFSKMMDLCDFPLDVEDALFTKALEANNITLQSPNISESQIMKMGPAVVNFDDSYLKLIPEKVMLKGLARVKKFIEKQEDKVEARENLGLGTDVSETDKATKLSRKSRFYVKAAQTVIAKREGAVTTTASSRKRRAVTYSVLTCNDLKKMGSGVTSLSTSQLDIANAEFTSCYEFLGKETGWSSAQKTQLATTATRVWGASSTWTSSKLLLSGTISQGLTDSQLTAIAKATYTNDIVAALGKYSGWTSGQISAGYGQYIARVGAVSSLTSTDLQSLGVFTSGIPSSDITASIAPAKYKGAASQIGAQTGLSLEQLQAFATVAQKSDAYGAISTWDAATIAAVGSVMGGLSASQISTLSTAQIEGMSASTISNLPASVFAGFTSAQLSAMSTNQRRSISSTQASYLSASAKGTLQSSGDFVTATPTGSASSFEGFLGLQVAAVAFLLRNYFL